MIVFQFPLFQNLTEIEQEIPNLSTMRYVESLKMIQVKYNNTWYDYKYYNPFTPVALVPVMTGDTTPSGKCFGSSNYNESYSRFFYPFDGNSSTGWTPTYGTGNNYIGYDFGTPVNIQKVEAVFKHLQAATSGLKNCKLQASDSEATGYVDVGTFTIRSSSAIEEIAINVDIPNDIRKRYWRVFVEDALAVSGNYSLLLTTMQFYGYE